MPIIAFDLYTSDETSGTKIGSRSSITNIFFLDKKHEITLFADYLILSLTDLASSLPEVYKLLKVFNTVFYYKIAKSKLNILSIGLDKLTKSHVEQ